MKLKEAARCLENSGSDVYDQNFSKIPVKKFIFQ